LFLEKYRMNLESAQSNYQELKVTLQRLLEETQPGLVKHRKKALDLLNEYTEKYQLVKFTVGLTNDSDFHEFIKETVQPLERLIEKAKQLKANGFLNDYKTQLEQFQRVVINRKGSLSILVSKIKERETQFNEHCRLNLDPLAKKLESLSVDGFKLSALAKLSNVVGFSKASRSVTGGQQKSWFSMLDKTSKRPELVITSRETAAASYKGTISSSISRILPALKLNGTISRNQGEGKRLKKRYKKLLHSSLIQIYDYNAPAADVRTLLSKESHLRKKQINLLMGEVSSKWNTSASLLDNALSSGSEIDRAVKDLLGLYILEYGKRSVTDRKLQVLIESDEYKKLAQSIGLAANESSDNGNVDSDSKYKAGVKILIKLKKLISSKSGKLLYPRLDSQMSDELNASITLVKTGIQSMVSGHYRNKVARLTVLAAQLNPETLTDSPSEKAMAEARAILDNEKNNKQIKKLVATAESVNISVSKPVNRYKSKAKLIKEYLEMLGG